MKEYRICNLRVESEGASVGNYKFRRVDDYQERIGLLYSPERRTEKGHKMTFGGNNKEQITEQTNHVRPDSIVEPMRYGSHQVTALASIDGEEKASVFSKGKTAIYDILLLYSFLTGYNACLEGDIEGFSHLDKDGVSFGGDSTVAIDTALKELSKLEWTNGSKDKEILSFLFFLDAKDHKKFQISFIEYHTALEILELGRSLNGAIFDKYKISEIILNFNKNDFTNTIKIIRNKYVHEGNCTLNVFKKGIEEKNKEIKRNETPIADKLKGYLTNIDDSGFGQFKIDTSVVMDYLLCQIYSQIFCIKKIVNDFNKYYLEQVQRYFSSIYR